MRSTVVVRVRIVLAALLAALALGLPLSPWGIAHATGLCTWLLAPKLGPLARRMALLIVVATVAARMSFPTALDGEGVRLVGESDIAVPAAALLPLVEPDAKGLRASMSARYRAMRADVGDPPLPLFHSWLGREATLRLDVREPTLGVVFLHGYAGNFALPCWHVARAAREAGGSTRCPSSGFHARWTEIQRVRREIRHLREAGAPRVVLAGISAGAIGASRLAPELRREIDGLLLLAGVSARAGAPRVPVLTIGGRRDRMTSPGALRRYGRRYGRHVSLEGGHFALLEEHAVAHEAMVTWLSERVRDAANRTESGPTRRRPSRR